MLNYLAAISFIARRLGAAASKQAIKFMSPMVEPGHRELKKWSEIKL